MGHSVADDKERAKEILLPAINGAKEAMDQKRHEIANLAAYRARCVLELREYFTAAEIGSFLGISRQAVHAMIGEADPDLNPSAVMDLLAANDDLEKDIDMEGILAAGEQHRRHPE